MVSSAAMRLSMVGGVDVEIERKIPPAYLGLKSSIKLCKNEQNYEKTSVDTFIIGLV
jgi:O-acetyl-ADP-ribose deacetylase (regulator of RNase III)